jgi:hypothetical protein
MRIPSTTPLLAPAAVAVMGMLLLTPIHSAVAAGANGAAKATLGNKVTTTVRDLNGAVGKLRCVGPYCPRSGAEYKATTTGTYKPNPIPITSPTPTVRDHRGAGPRTKPTRPGPKRDTICAGWFC